MRHKSSSQITPRRGGSTKLTKRQKDASLDGAFFAPTGQKFIGEPRVLFLDIETAPILGWVWGIWQADVIEIVENTTILCFAYRWRNERRTQVVSRRMFRGYRKDLKDDRRVCDALWELLDEADVIIAHNGDRFDVKKIQARFLHHKMEPPRPFITLDTLKWCRRLFALDSNKQDEIGKQLQTGRKTKHHGAKTWFGCMSGELREWKIMERYNKQDVDLLIANYERLLPWVTWKENRRKPMPVKRLS